MALVASQSPFDLPYHPYPFQIQQPAHCPDLGSHVLPGLFRIPQMLRIYPFNPHLQCRPPCLHIRLIQSFGRHRDLLLKANEKQPGRPTPVFYFKIVTLESIRNPIHIAVTIPKPITSRPTLHLRVEVATRFWFHKHFCHILSLPSISPILYSGHSFRIGAATTASRTGSPEHLMQITGRCSSQAYQRYIRSDLKVLQAAQSHLT